MCLMFNLAFEDIKITRIYLNKYDIVTNIIITNITNKIYKLVILYSQYLFKYFMY